MPVDFQIDELCFGRVREINGHTITILASSLECRYFASEYTVELGSFINLAAPKSDLIAIISSIRIVEAPQVASAGIGITFEDRKLVEVTLVGFLRDGTTFERGIERYPIIGTKAFLLTEDAIKSMFEGIVKNGIPVGERCQRGGGTEFAHADRFFGRHTAILGTTGSGKSWTVASLLQNAMSVMPHTRFVFFDLHDEYRAAFPQNYEILSRQVTHILSKDLILPYWCFNVEELQELFLSTEHTAQNQAAIFKRIVRELRVEQATTLQIDENRLSVDTPVYFSFDELINRLRHLDTEMIPGKNSAEKQGTHFGKLTNLIMRMEALKTDPRYSFLFSSMRMENKGLQELFEELLGFTNGSQMTIIDLSGLPSEILSVIVGILCRLAFDYKYWDLDPQDLPLTLILEEAHNYLPRGDYARDKICLERVERIAKEGRKYGINMVIVSQRPSELNDTVLSQCANVIAMRLSNPNDQAYVCKLLPDFLAVTVEMLPYLRTGEAIFAGEAVELPTRVRIKAPNPQPQSHDIRYFERWCRGVSENYSVETVIERWRRRER